MTRKSRIENTPEFLSRVSYMSVTFIRPLRRSQRRSLEFCWTFLGISSIPQNILVYIALHTVLCIYYVFFSCHHINWLTYFHLNVESITCTETIILHDKNAWVCLWTVTNSLRCSAYLYMHLWSAFLFSSPQSPNSLNSHASC